VTIGIIDPRRGGTSTCDAAASAQARLLSAAKAAFTKLHCSLYQVTLLNVTSFKAPQYNATSLGVTSFSVT
jgi:hypothetical protein